MISKKERNQLLAIARAVTVVAQRLGKSQADDMVETINGTQTLSEYTRSLSQAIREMTEKPKKR